MGRKILTVWFGILLMSVSLSCNRHEEQPLVFEVDGSQTWPISRYIYGWNWANWQEDSQFGITLDRWGGNRTTTYNWETNASNAGSDFHNQNDDYLGKSNIPGELVRRRVAAAFSADASIIVTIPILGYVAADKDGDGDVSKNPQYLHKRFVVSLPRKNGPFSLTPDVTDQKVYQDEFVHWLEKTFPDAGKDSRRTIFYCLDNEPDLWPETHPRIHPNKTTYQELVRLNIEYAQAIKSVASRAMVFGFVSYGFAGYRNLQDAPDAHGMDFLDFYLQNMRQAEQTYGKRLVDVLDLHWASEAQGGGVRITDDNSSPPVAQARIQAPRSLWDPIYMETSWITRDVLHGPIRLIPRLREKIRKDYPGTKLAFSEYAFGGGGDISGAIAQADALGIFGREKVFAAAIWPADKDNRFIAAAFRMYRNFDGQGGAFGDTGLASTNPDPSRASLYASRDAQGRIIIVAINKTSKTFPIHVILKNNSTYQKALVFRLTKAAPKPKRGEDVSITQPGILDSTLPPLSISTFVLTP